METLSSDPQAEAGFRMFNPVPRQSFFSGLGIIFLTVLTLVADGQPLPMEPAHTVVKATFYYSVNWELTSPAKAFYKRVSNFDLNDMAFDGVYKDYTIDDRLTAEGLYSHGEKRGLQYEYFNDRSLKSTMEFIGRDFIIWELHAENHETLVQGGTGAFTVWYMYQSGLVSSPVWKQGVLNGEFRMGRRTGKWTYSDLNKTKTDEETYQNGKLIRRYHYFEDGLQQELDYPKEVIVSVNTMVTDSFVLDHDVFPTLADMFSRMITYPAGYNRSITSPGGIKSLLRELSRTADIPEGYVAVVQVKMDAAGKVSKLKVYNVEEPVMRTRAEKAVRAVQGRLLPAIRNGKPWPSTISLPISQGQEWTEVINATRPTDLTQSGQTGSGTRWANILGWALVVLLLVATFI